MAKGDREYRVALGWYARCVGPACENAGNWRAGCWETGTSGSVGGGRKRVVFGYYLGKDRQVGEQTAPRRPPTLPCITSLPRQGSGFPTSCEEVAAHLSRGGLSISLMQANAVASRLRAA